MRQVENKSDDFRSNAEHVAEVTHPFDETQVASEEKQKHQEVAQSQCRLVQREKGVEQQVGERVEPENGHLPHTQSHADPLRPRCGFGLLGALVIEPLFDEDVPSQTYSSFVSKCVNLF